MCLLLYGLECQLLTKEKERTVQKPRLRESPVRVWTLLPGSHGKKGKYVRSLKSYSSPEALKSEEQLSCQEHDLVTLTCFQK